MNVVVQKVGEKDGVERFVLLNQKTGDVITKNDVSEPTLRKYLLGAGETEKLIDDCLHKARRRYDKSHASKDDDADQEGLDDIFSEIGLDDETDG